MAENVLYKLPAELRNWIYEACLLPREKPYQVEKVVKPNQTRFVYSKAIRCETVSIHYGTNIFRLLNIAILKDWLDYIGSERRAALRYVQCMELPPPLTPLFLRFRAPPLYHALHALEYFEMTLARDDLEISAGALHFPLCVRRPRGHEWQVCFCGPLRHVGNEIWSSASDVARRLSDQDWSSYVDIRLAVENLCTSLMKSRSSDYDAHELAFESVNG
jgi:hypothetical protein